MAPKAVRSAIALAFCTLIFGIAAIDSEAAEGTGKASPELPPWAFKVFSKDGSESLTADCTPKDFYQEGHVPTEITCRFIHVRFQSTRSSGINFASIYEEVLNKDPTTADESRKNPEKFRKEVEENKRSFAKMLCSGSGTQEFKSQIAELDPSSARKRAFADIINACSKEANGDNFVEVIRLLESESTACGLWLDHFNLDFRRIDKGKWLFTQQRPGLLSGTLKVYELAAESGYGLWTLTETKMTMGQEENTGSKPFAERKVWRWDNWDSYEIPGECRFISHKSVQFK
jgi:hypothetical protein